jgi:hypothetical protein
MSGDGEEKPLEWPAHILRYRRHFEESVSEAIYAATNLQAAQFLTNFYGLSQQDCRRMRVRLCMFPCVRVGVHVHVYLRTYRSLTIYIALST